MKHKKILKILFSIVLILMILKNVVFAQESLNNSSNINNQIDSVLIGDDALNSGTPVKIIEKDNLSISPQITHFVVEGNGDSTKTGIDFYKNISITLIGDNLTDRNFLTEEGLHWSDKTYVELIKGQELGVFDDLGTFKTQDSSVMEIKAYSNNNGDSGRINFVGRTKSDEDLDLIWTVIDSNKDDWAANSGYANDGHIKGLGFTGEQFIPGSVGNSIVVLYNNANNLGINYKIVKHGTMEEMPVVLSFILTDIDVAQGVGTNLANITEIIPNESGLAKDDNIIYDRVKEILDLNGSVDLPKGGYLGAGFLSSFDYKFYAPAPSRMNDLHYYPKLVRYDIFGSSLQAKLYTRIKNHITVSYIDELGNEIKPSENFVGFNDEKYFFESATIPKYKLIDVIKDETTSNHSKIQFVYKKIIKPVDKKEDIKIDFKEQIKEKSQTNLKPINNSQKVHVNNINAYSINTPINIPINTQKNKVQIINSTHKKVVSKESSVKDPFLENTGMSKEEKEAFLNYIKAVAKDSRDRNGNDKNKINHDIANALAYSVYHNDFLQRMTNDFGEKPKELSGEIKKILDLSHVDTTYKIDFPHLAAPLATAEKSVWWKELGKTIVGLSPLNLLGEGPSDVMFMNNSMTGDLLTNIDDKDTRTDIDAYIFRYHPKFKDLLLDERIEQYYSIDNLEAKRQIYYKEVLELRGVGNKAKDYSGFINWGSAISLAGLGLIGLVAFRKLEKEWEEFNKGKLAYLNKKVWIPLTEGKKEFTNNPLKFIGNRVLYPVNKFATGVSSAGGIVAKIVENKVNDALNNTVKPIVKPIIEPIKKVTNFISKEIVKPTVNLVDKTIIKPIQKVSSYVYDKVVKPVGSFINKNIVKPIGNFLNKLFIKK